MGRVKPSQVEAAGVEVPQDTQGETPIQHQGGAENGALPLDAADLALVIRLLSRLTPDQAQALVTLAQATSSTRSPES
jgi:hypothetical protein